MLAGMNDKGATPAWRAFDKLLASTVMMERLSPSDGSGTKKSSPRFTLPS